MYVSEVLSTTPCASSKASSGGAIGKKMAIAKLGPKLAPWLAKHGLALQDVLPALELVDSVEELIEAVEDPHTFLDRLVSRLGPVLKATASAPAALVGVEPEPNEVNIAETDPQHHARSSTALTAKSVFSAVALLAHALTRQMKEFVDMLRQASGTGANPVRSTVTSCLRKKQLARGGNDAAAKDFCRGALVKIWKLLAAAAMQSLGKCLSSTAQELLAMKLDPPRETHEHNSKLLLESLDAVGGHVLALRRGAMEESATASQATIDGRVTATVANGLPTAAELCKEMVKCVQTSAVGVVTSLRFLLEQIKLMLSEQEGVTTIDRLIHGLVCMKLAYGLVRIVTDLQANVRKIMKKLEQDLTQADKGTQLKSDALRGAAARKRIRVVQESVEDGAWQLVRDAFMELKAELMQTCGVTNNDCLSEQLCQLNEQQALELQEVAPVEAPAMPNVSLDTRDVEQAARDAVDAAGDAMRDFLDQFQIIMAYLQTLGIVIAIDVDWPPWFKFLAINVSFPFMLEFNGLGSSAAAETLLLCLAPVALLLASVGYMRSPILWQRRLGTADGWSQYWKAVMWQWAFGSLCWYVLISLVERGCRGSAFCAGQQSYIAVLDDASSSASSGDGDIEAESVVAFFTTIEAGVSLVLAVGLLLSLYMRKLHRAIEQSDAAQGRFFVSSNASVMTAAVTLFTVCYMPVCKRLLDHVGEMQFAHWQFWAYSLCCFAFLLGVPLWLIVLSDREIKAGRRLSDLSGRSEFHKGSMLAYSEYVASDRLLCESRATLKQLNNLRDDYHCFLDDPHRTERVATQTAQRHTRARRGWLTATAFHSEHTSTSALMSLHTGVKSGHREYWKLATVFVERALLVCFTTLWSSRAMQQTVGISAVVVVFALLALLLQPFEKSTKNRMDLVARVTSTLNVVAALALLSDAHWLGGHLDALLVMWNGATAAYMAKEFNPRAFARVLWGSVTAQRTQLKAADIASLELRKTRGAELLAATLEGDGATIAAMVDADAAGDGVADMNYRGELHGPSCIQVAVEKDNVEVVKALCKAASLQVQRSAENTTAESTKNLVLAAMKKPSLSCVVALMQQCPPAEVPSSRTSVESHAEHGKSAFSWSSVLQTVQGDIAEFFVGAAHHCVSTVDAATFSSAVLVAVKEQRHRSSMRRVGMARWRSFKRAPHEGDAALAPARASITKQAALHGETKLSAPVQWQRRELTVTGLTHGIDDSDSNVGGKLSLRTNVLLELYTPFVQTWTTMLGSDVCLQ